MSYAAIFEGHIVIIGTKLDKNVTNGHLRGEDAKMSLAATHWGLQSHQWPLAGTSMWLVAMSGDINVISSHCHSPKMSLAAFVRGPKCH